MEPSAEQSPVSPVPPPASATTQGTADYARQMEQIERAHRAEIFRFFMRSGLTESDAQDQTQVVLTKTFRTLPTFRGECGIRTWVYRLAHNALVDYKARRREVLVDDTLPQQDGETYDSDKMPQQAVVWGNRETDPEERAMQQDLREQVRRGLDQLPAEQKIAMLLTMQGYSHQEIADVQKRTPTAVKMTVHRARIKLRELLEPVAREHGMLS